MTVTNEFYERSIATGQVIPQSEFEALQAAFDQVKARFLAQTVDYVYENQTAMAVTGPGVLNLDLAGPGVFTHTLTEDITLITSTNVPAAGIMVKAVLLFTQNSVGGHSINFGAIRFAGGTPTIGAAAGDTTIITIFSYDAGVTTFGVSSGVALA